MRYTYFEIENFKGIQYLRLDLNTPPKGPIHTLVGLNECGKTTVLEAMDYFTKGNEAPGPKELAGRLRPDEHDLIPIAERANFNGRIFVRAGVELDDIDIELLKKHLKQKDNYQLNDFTREFSVTDIYTFADSTFDQRKAEWAIKGTGRPTRVHNDRDLYKDDLDIWQDAVAFLTSQMPPIWYFPNFLFDFPKRIYLVESPSDTQTDQFYRALL